MLINMSFLLNDGYLDRVPSFNCLYLSSFTITTFGEGRRLWNIGVIDIFGCQEEFQKSNIHVLAWWQAEGPWCIATGSKSNGKACVRLKWSVQLKLTGIGWLIECH